MIAYGKGLYASGATAIASGKEGATWVKMPNEAYFTGVQFPASMVSESAKLQASFSSDGSNSFCPVDPVAVAMDGQDNSPQNIISVASGSTISGLYVEIGHRIRSLHKKSGDLYLNVETSATETAKNVTFHFRIV